MLRGAQSLAVAGAPVQRAWHHLGPLGRRGAAAARRRVGAARPRVRRGRGVGPGRGVELGEGPISLASDAHNAAVDQASRVAARRVRQGARARRRRGAGRGVGAHAPHRRRAGRHGGAPDGRQGRPGHRRRAGHALRVRPVGPRLHPAAAGRLDARRARLRRQLRLRPPPHRRHGDEADDPERGADQLHRGHVLGPRVGHGEDAALRPGGRGRGRGRGQGHRGPDAASPATPSASRPGGRRSNSWPRRTSSSSPQVVLPLDDAVVTFEAESLRSSSQGKGRKR